MGESVLSVCKRITSVCIFAKKRTNDKLPFAQWGNDKRIKENRLGFHVPFDVSMSGCLCLHVSIFSMFPRLHVYVSMFPRLHPQVSMSPCFRKQKTELTENANFHLFATNETGKRKFVFQGRTRLFQQTWPSMLQYNIVARRRWKVLPGPKCGLHPLGANCCPLWREANG